MKRIPIAKYLSTRRKETNLHQSDIVSASVMTGIFEPPGAHHQFNKNGNQLKKVYNSIFDGDRQSRYLTNEVPLAVTVGAERLKPFAEMSAHQSILSNTPFNV